MTATSVDRIQRSYEKLVPRLHDFTAAFYDRLFVTLPEVRTLFPTQLEAQRNHFAAALALIVRNLSVLDALEEPLRVLGATHARLGVLPDHYPAVCDAISFALAQTLDRHWTQDVAHDWQALLLTVSRHMLAGSLEREQ